MASKPSVITISLGKVDDDEIRAASAMVPDPYDRILAETWKASDDMVIESLRSSQSLLFDKGKLWLPICVPF